MELAGDAGALALPDFVHGFVELPQLLVRVLELVSRPLTLGDVAQDHRVELRARHRDVRDRRVYRKLLPRGAQAVEDHRLSHASHRRSGFSEPLHVLTMRRPKAFGNESIERRAHRFARAALEDLLGSRIEQADVVLLVDGNDCIHGGADDRIEPHLPFGHVGHQCRLQSPFAPQQERSRGGQCSEKNRPEDDDGRIASPGRQDGRHRTRDYDEHGIVRNPAIGDQTPARIDYAGPSSEPLRKRFACSNSGCSAYISRRSVEGPDSSRPARRRVE